MDDALFDRLTRGFRHGATRRALLATLATIAPASMFEHAAWAKKGHHKKHKKKKKKSTPPSGGSCTLSDGDVLSLVTQQSFKGKSLQATQTVDSLVSGRAAGKLEVTLGGALVLSMETATNTQAATTTITYGSAFQGVQRASFSTDGTTITGDVDGRAIVPLPVGADLQQAQFTDGGPPPTVQVDPALAQAIVALLNQASQDANNCTPATPQHAAHRKPGKRHGHRVETKDVNPANQPKCLLAYEVCKGKMAYCVYLAAVASIGCGPFAPLCAGGAMVGCALDAELCRRIAQQTLCCPVKCGGEPIYALFMEDPGCCEESETCIDPNDADSNCCAEGFKSCQNQTCCADDLVCQPDAICCRDNESSCHGACCPKGSCINNEFCCAPPNGVGCAGSCCPPLTRSCCNEACCPGDCINNTCCQAPKEPCRGNRGEACCPPGKCCNGLCCGPTESCQNNFCTVICNPNLQVPCPPDPGFPTCCEKGTICCRNGQCCPAFTPICCGDGCCLVGEECCPDNVCRTNCLH